MPIPFVIDNQEHKLADVLNDLLARGTGRPLDVATAYFTISGYRVVKERLHEVGAFRLLVGAEPQGGPDVGLRARVKSDLASEPFNKATLLVVEELIAFLRSEKVQVRLFDRGFLQAKAYLFHQDRVGPNNPADRMLPFAAIVGSSNFTGPGLTSNRELNLVHRVLLPEEQAVDHDAAERARYVEPLQERETLLDPAGIHIPEPNRRRIKSEVGARAITDLTRWFEFQWAESVNFKAELIDLLDASKRLSEKEVQGIRPIPWPFSDT